MSRLTKRYNNGIVTLNASAFMETQETIDREIQNCYPAKKAIERLADYEDAEENGLMVRLPCKVGDTVWYVPPAECRAGEGEYVVTGFLFDKGGCQIRTYSPKGVIIYFYLEYIGKTVFLTREEAEKALEERDSK